MRLLKITTTLGLIIAATFALIHHHSKLLETKEVHQKEINRTISSTNSFRRPTDVFEVERKISAVLHSPQVETKKNLISLDYHGLFQVKWLKENQASLSFQLTNGMQSSVEYQVELEHWSIVKIAATAPQTEADEQSLNILKDFSALWAYESNEDTTGKFDATLKQMSDTLWTKQKLAYHSSPITIQKSNAQYIVNGATRFPESGKGSEFLRAELMKGSFILTSTHFKFNKSDKLLSTLQAKAAAPVENLVQTSLELEDKSHAGFQPWSNLSAKLRHIHEFKQIDQLKLFHEIIKTLKQDKSSLNDFLSWSTKNFDKQGIRTFAVGVLATSASDEAQHKLIEWYEQYPESRHVIINALATTSATLNPETHEFLNHLIAQMNSDPETATAGAFALGSSLRNDSEPSPSDLKRLEELLSQSNSIQDQENALDAIGNSGNRYFLPQIETSLESPEERIRAKAVLALRFMQNADTEQFIADAWNDPSAKVKQAAIQVIALQSKPMPSYKKILTQCIESFEPLQAECKRVQTHLSI